jgi:hypothetical protein
MDSTPLTASSFRTDSERQVIRLVPKRLAAWMVPLEQGFTVPTWQHVLVLVLTAILAPARTVALPPPYWVSSGLITVRHSFYIHDIFLKQVRVI